MLAPERRLSGSMRVVRTDLLTFDHAKTARQAPRNAAACASSRSVLHDSFHSLQTSLPQRHPLLRDQANPPPGGPPAPPRRRQPLRRLLHRGDPPRPPGGRRRRRPPLHQAVQQAGGAPLRLRGRTPVGSWWKTRPRWPRSPRAPRRSNVLVRLRVSNKDAVVDLSYKFGAQVRGRPRACVQAARRAKLRPRGLSFHVGSQCTNPFAYADALASCRQLFNLAASKRIILTPSTSAAASPSPTSSRSCPIDRFCEPIAEAIEKYFDQMPGHRRAGPVPGGQRGLAHHPGDLASPSAAGWPGTTSTTASTAASPASSSTTASTPSSRSADGDRELCVIAGPTCDSFDVLYTDRAAAARRDRRPPDRARHGRLHQRQREHVQRLPLTRLVAF